MGSRDLPVLTFAPFRKYPTKSDQQVFDDDRQVCHSCVSGVCCSNQDPIYLTSFDVFRLAAFFDMSPGRFMLTFTQDQFDGEPPDFRRLRNEDPNDSVVTWLRRRTSLPTSPCIFLKYIHEPDGTPRRVCSVHEGRPLSCREFYFDTCKVRGTGELASLLAEGFEKLRDGEITEAIIDANLAQFGEHEPSTSTLAASMEYYFWAEMKCAINSDQTNIEGSNSYDMAQYQDPIDEKLNRVLSAKHLRFEESYGSKPRDEQLMPYTGGLSFAGSSEYERIMSVVTKPPSSGVFSLGSYPHGVGVRTSMSGVKHSEQFPVIPDTEIRSFLDTLPDVTVFPQHDVDDVRRISLREIYASVLKAINHLIRISSHIIDIGIMLENHPDGTLERELLEMFEGFETSLNPYIARNAYLQPIKAQLARQAVDLLEDDLRYELRPAEFFGSLQLLYAARNAAQVQSPEMESRVAAIDRELKEGFQRDDVVHHLLKDNPVEGRRIAGKSLRAAKAWQAWTQQITDMRYASLAGYDQVDLTSFFRRCVDDLEKIPFHRSYSLELCDLVRTLSKSMTFNHRIAYEEMPYRDAADRLAQYGVQLYKRIGNSGKENSQEQSVIEMFTAVSKGLGLSYDHDREFGLLIRHLLNSQLLDGSWQTNLLGSDEPDDQGEYLRMHYRPTGAFVDALRPLRNDVRVPGNDALGLV